MLQPRPSTRATPPSIEELGSPARGAEASSTRGTGVPDPTSRDLTTGLPNRWTLQKTLAEWAWKTHRNGELLILVVIRMTEGDGTSESGSPDQRNRILRDLGRRIAMLMGPGALLGRWDTDRLLLISRGGTAGGDRELALLRKIRRVAGEFDQSLSIGTTSNEEIHDPPGLIRRAESALGPAPSLS